MKQTHEAFQSVAVRTGMITGFVLFSSALVQAQEVVVHDSVPSTREVKNRNVMLNASSDSQPRQISIGLPSTMTSNIYEDGLPVSYYFWPSMPFWSWSSGASTTNNSLMSLSESAIRYGNVNYTVTDDTRHAGEEFVGLLNYSANHHGKQLVDAHVSGPLSHGWGYTLSTYQNFDPGSNHLPSGGLQNRQEMYKAGVNKFFDNHRGEFQALYMYAHKGGVSDEYGPFVYHAKDGSVSKFYGFTMGKDAYLPATETIDYIDIATGKRVTSNQHDQSHSYTHQVRLNLKYNWDNGNTLNVRAKYKSGDSGRCGLMVSGVSFVDESAGYTYMNLGTESQHGQIYSGPIENRFMRNARGTAKDLLFNAELTGGKNTVHSWRVGLDQWYNKAEVENNTGMTAHEAKADPFQLLLNGNVFYNVNSAGEYYSGHENKLAVYASDDWTVNNRLWMSAGIRLQWLNIGGEAALSTEGNPNNRFVGWSMKDATRVPFLENFLENSLTFNGRYTLLKGFGLTGEYVFNRHFTVLEDYAGNAWPTKKPVLVNAASGGIYWNNDWIQLTSQLTFISQTTYKARMDFQHVLTKDVNGMSAGTIENVAIPVTYGIQTMGWTTDFMLTPFPHFSLHGLLTLQDPQYRKFIFNPTFSDGISEQHDFTHHNVTAMSKCLIEIDPTYTNGPWKVWLSARYQSKQYINKTNSLYFKGRWETFGGVSYSVNKHLSFDLNLVNLLNQTGASGKIGIADLVEKEDLNGQYDNYVMSGTYIRPFTIEATAHLKF